MDRLDIGVLRLLQEQGDAAPEVIGERLGIPAEECVRRIHRLENDGVISGYVALVDNRAVDLPLAAFILVTLASQSEDAVRDFEERIAKENSVVECYAIFGEDSYIIKLSLPDIDELNFFIRRKILTIARMSIIHTSIVTHVVKYTTAINLNSHRAG